MKKLKNKGKVITVRDIGWTITRKLINEDVN